LAMRQLEQPLDTRDVVIGPNRYQISRMNAQVGSWLLFKLMDALRKIASDVNQDGAAPDREPNEQEKEAAANGLITAMLMTLDRELFEQVQREALKVCGQYTMVGEREVILPVLMANGSLAVPDLKNDIAGVVALTSNALHYNLSPFFLGNGLNQMFQAS
jgi:hypothetical protein